MAVAVRTVDLRKTYTSSPPLGAAGGFIARADARGSKQGKIQIAALDGLSLDVQPGEIFGLLGPNGAGKSTTIGVLTTRVRPTSGQAWIGDHEVWREQVVIKHLIGVVPQRPNLDFSLTARDRRPPARAHQYLLDRDRKSDRRHDSGHNRRTDSDPTGMAGASPRRRYKRSRTTDTCSHHSAGGGVFRLRRPGARVQHQSAAHRFNVRHGDHADDFLRLHLLSVERVEEFPGAAKTCTRQSAGVCERRTAGVVSATVSSLDRRRRTRGSGGI